MTGSLLHLILASITFAGSHMVLSDPRLRDPISARLGEWGFVGLYSAVSIATLAWMIMAYIAAPIIDYWDPYIGFKHASLTLMILACFLLVCGYTTPNPGAFAMEEIGLKSGPRGVLKITRHPVMWGTALWGISHVLANGHVAALIFFGTLSGLALFGAVHIDRKKAARLGAPWEEYMARTSFVPLAAVFAGRTRVERSEIKWWQTLLTVLLYVVMIIAHAEWGGRDVLPI